MLLNTINRIELNLLCLKDLLRKHSGGLSKGKEAFIEIYLDEAHEYIEKAVQVFDEDEYMKQLKKINGNDPRVKKYKKKK